MLTPYGNKQLAAASSRNYYDHMLLEATQRPHLERYKKKLDPTQAEMIQGDHPAIKVANLIESGQAREFLKAGSPVTWLGHLFDWIWGIDHPKLAEQTRRSVLNNDDQDKPPIDCNSLGTKIAKVNVTTSFDAHKNPDNSCSFLNPKNYFVGVFAFNGNHSPNDLFCRMQSCVQDHIFLSGPSCLPCESAQGLERTERDDVPFYSSNFVSKYFKDKEWIIVTGEKEEEVYTWKVSQINKTFKGIIERCEDEEYNKEIQKTILNRILVVLASGAASFTVLWGGFVVYNRCIAPKVIKKDEEKDSLLPIGTA
jgi:hypothetical protein